MADLINKFPNDIEVTRINTMRDYHRLYENHQSGVLPLHEMLKKQFNKESESLYIAHAIPSKISDFYGDFVQGDVTRLRIYLADDSEDSTKTLNDIIKTNNLKERIYDFAVNQSEFGYECLVGYVEAGKFKIASVGKDQYFPQPDGSVIFATYIRDPQDSNPDLAARKLFVYTQHYRLEGGKTIVDRQAWLTDGKAKIKEAVTLERIGITAQPTETIDLDILPIVQIDNGRKTKWQFGKSDYADIMPQLQEINERTTHISTQLLKNLDAILELPQVDGLKDEAGNWKKVDTIELPNNETARGRFITNENPLLDEAFKHIDRQLHMISWLSGVPMFELLQSGQPERVESMRIKMFNAIRKTDTKRARITKGVQEIIEIGFKMLKKDLGDNEIVIEYSDVLPTDPLIEAQIEETKVRAGISSKESAMRRLENYDSDEAAAELERINQENIAGGAIDPNAAPIL